MTTAERRVIQHRFAPRGAAFDLMTNKAGEILLSGPAGTGKSRACLEKLNFCALKYAGMRGLIVRKTAVSLTSTALVTYRKQVINQILANRTVHWYGGSGQEPAQFRYSNGSTIAVGGMDKATRIMSSEYDMIFVQEAIELTLNDWESLTTRLRNGVMPYQQLIADTNPDADTHWLNQRAHAGATLMLESRHEDNPMLFEEMQRTGSALLITQQQGKTKIEYRVTERGADYMAKLDGLTGVRKLRLRDGLWVAAEGVVYETWDRGVHLVDRFEIPADWPRWWGVDFGYRNPFVLQRWAEDPDGRLVLYAETYMTGRIVEDHAKAILGEVTNRKGEWREPRPRAVICDHDAEDRATLERHLGLSTVAAKKDVTPGIQAVESRLKVDDDGKPRIAFFLDAVGRRDPALVDAARPASTVEEFPVYVWDKKPGKPAKDMPVKENDHGLDAMRYVVAHRDLRGEFKIRFM